MLVKNDEKTIINTTWAHKTGKLWHYIIDTPKMQLMYVVYVENDRLYYVYAKDIEDIGDNILIKSSTLEAPEDIDEYTKLYPTASVVDTNGKEYGLAKYIEINGLIFNNLLTETAKVCVENIVRTSNEYTICLPLSPEPTPPKPSLDETSIKYAWLIGKRATKSIYACHNTPIIVSGEIVGIENIINAILTNKLIELMNSIE